MKRPPARTLVLPSDIPVEWQRIAEMQKAPLDWPVWPDPPQQPKSRGVATRDDLQTSAGQTVSVVIALADSSGAGLEGVRLRLVAWPFRREYDLTATLEVPGGRGFVTIARVDCWPSSPHVNTLSRRHGALRHLPPIIESHHSHRFTDNARLGKAAFAPLGNLPAAAPLDETIGSFRDFVRVVRDEFGIAGIDQFGPPDWQRLF
jgi:hypothetical protein